MRKITPARVKAEQATSTKSLVIKVALALIVTVALALTLIPAANATAQRGQLSSYADVAEIAMPAVVNISTDKLVDNSAQHPFMNDPMFRRFFNMPDDENHNSDNNSERVEHSLGSGIVISSDGYILTNSHVVANADKVHVTFVGEQEYLAEIVGTDPRTDVALLKIDATNLPALKIADSKKLRVGDQVMAIGNPFGVGQTVTMGIVSAVGRSIGLIDYEDMIQTDASINPGNSGGALVDMNGALVGMNAAILSRSGGSQGVGFAIPTSMTERIVTALKDHGEVQRAYLGVLPQPMDQGMADYYGLDRPRGVIIATVNEDTPAEKAGLEVGDILLKVDGREIKNPSMLRNTISLMPVDQKTELLILRDGSEKTVTVKLGELPDPSADSSENDVEDANDNETLDGVRVTEISERLRTRISLPDDIEGVIVAEIEATSNAAREGLASSDVIMEIGGQSVTTLNEFREALGKNTDRPIFMRVFHTRSGRSTFMAVPR